MGTLTWVEYILKHIHSIHCVKIIRNNKIHIFKIFARKVDNQTFDENEIVVTFEDITNELENEAILRKIQYIQLHCLITVQLQFF